MGFVTMQCALSSLPIDVGARVRVLTLHAPPRGLGRTLYAERSWTVRSAPLPMKYGGYANVFPDPGPVPWAELAREALALELVPQPVGANPFRDTRIERSHPLGILFAAAFAGRLTLRPIGDRDPTPEAPPAAIPTWRRVERVLRAAGIPGRAFPRRPYPQVGVALDDACPSGEARRAWSDAVIDAVRAAGWRAQHTDDNDDHVNVISPDRALALPRHAVVVTATDHEAVFAWRVRKQGSDVWQFHAPPRRVGLALVRDDVWRLATASAGYETVTRRNLATIHQMLRAADEVPEEPEALRGPEVPGRSLLRQHDDVVHAMNRFRHPMTLEDASAIFGQPFLDAEHAGLLWQLVRARALSRESGELAWSEASFAEFLQSLAETATVMGLARDIGRPWAPSEEIDRGQWGEHECAHALWWGVARDVSRAMKDDGDAT